MSPASTALGGASADFGSRIARLMIYIVLCLVLMTLDFRGRWVEGIRYGAGYAAEPVWLLVETPGRLIGHLNQRWRDRSALVAERDALQLDLDRSRAELLVFDELVRENNRLRQLLDATASVDRDFLAVELRQIDLNPYSHRLLVNRGAREGLRIGQAVMDAHGLVGQVDQVFVHSASVILLTDPDHALPVEVERSRLRTIAYGGGQAGEVRLTDLPMNADIQVGDVLLSSGLGGRFQAGLPVADVSEVSRLPGEAFASATATLRARMEGARHLLVVTDRPAAGQPAAGEPALPGTAIDQAETAAPMTETPIDVGDPT